MLVICLLLAGTGIVAYLSGDELFISGANISISIVTLLLLPILQSTQNGDGAALQAKIDELIKASGKARDDLIGLENRAEAEIEQIRLDEGQRAKATTETCGAAQGRALIAILADDAAPDRCIAPQSSFRIVSVSVATGAPNFITSNRLRTVLPSLCSASCCLTCRPPFIV